MAEPSSTATANFRQLIRLYDYAVEQIYRRGMFLWLVPITQGKNAPPEQEARPGKGKRKPARPGSKERGAAARTQKKNQARTRFQGSKPVKKGKGSGRKNP